MESEKKSYDGISSELAKYHLHAENAFHSFLHETKDKENAAKLGRTLLELAQLLGAYSNLFTQMTNELLTFSLNGHLERR